MVKTKNPHWTVNFSTGLKTALAREMCSDLETITKESVVLRIVSGDILKAVGFGAIRLKEICDYFNLDVPESLDRVPDPEVIFLIEKLTHRDSIGVGNYTVIGYMSDNAEAFKAVNAANCKDLEPSEMVKYPRKYKHTPVRLIRKL